MFKRISPTVLFVILIVFTAEFVSAQDSNKVDLVRKQMVEKMDKFGLRFRNQAVVETSKEFLTIPQSIVAIKNKFTVAKTAPTIELCVIPIPNQERYQSIHRLNFTLHYGQVGDKVISRNLLKLIMRLLEIIVFPRPASILRSIIRKQKQLI